MASTRLETMTEYYPGYVAKNAYHFRDMLDQFRKAPTKEDRDAVAAMWVMDRGVDRQDILVALGRIERESPHGGMANG